MSGDATDRFVAPFRDPELGRRLLGAIARAARPGRTYALMEFCGGHTHAIARHGLPDLLPAGVRLIHGPGCPVCVLPVGRLDMALALAARPEVILTTYGDLLRIPASGGDTLFKARSRGADVRMVTSSLDAVALAAAQPDRQVVFMAIGFETTTPPTAVAVKQAEERGLDNFSILSNHVLTPPAIDAILGGSGAPRLDGIIGPAHVSTVIGWGAYQDLAARHQTPMVIAGFEPLDVLQAVHDLIGQVNAGRAEVGNQYARAVSRDGNPAACALVEALFEPRPDFAWRGLGRLPRSGLKLRPAYARFDAEARFELTEPEGREPPGCACGEVLKGATEPADCPLFATRCRPESPVGACMVSAEGACAAAHGHRRAPAAAPA
ncbi:hydrogenase formation protein HypD [Roseospirillum parvum]|uniref:Hydrogenase maturation factor n=1 Tax=Roseospirillum parvum TaxID=83401 RepID=A0A1G8B229_9PROT|nr:hydrogenase formation protein HypD [Roseospirillum parvum]SDH27181.1 hydrogenase expression/formation protein HypD [Roseospirillum parvum]